jgi:hypothetical protein
MSVAYLDKNLVGTSNRFEKVVCAPDYVVQRILQLVGALELFIILQDTPGEQTDGEGHWKLVLYIVSRIVIPSAQIHLVSHVITSYCGLEY